jgi:hypothetical protein
LLVTNLILVWRVETQMTDFSKFSASHLTVLLEDDYNNMLDHAFRSSYSYLVYYDSVDSLYKAKEGQTGLLHATTSTDAAVVINAVRSTLSSLGGGVIRFLDYPYQCATAITMADNIHFEGENQGSWEVFTKGCVLEYTGGAVDAFIDAIDCRNISFRKLKIYNSGSAAIGLWVGGTANDALKTKMMYMQEVTVNGFESGIVGYDADHWGPDDSVFVHVVVGNCSVVCIDNLSSMCKFYGGTFHTSPIGVRVGRQQAVATPLAADAGMQFYGTVWSGCEVPIECVGKQALNTLYFGACWIEDVDTMILRVTNADAGITLGTVIFDGCTMTTNSRIFMDLSGRNLYLEVNGGTLYPTIGGGVGVAEAGSNATTIVDASLTQADDFWNGYYVKAINGLNAGLERLVTDFDSATDALTVAAFPNAVAVGDVYLLGGAKIVTDGAGGTWQRVRIRNCGRDLLYFDDSNSGLAGFQYQIIPLMEFGPVGWQPGAPLNTTYVAVAEDHVLPVKSFEVIKATAVYHWNPGSISAQMRLFFTNGFAETADPSAIGVISEKVDCSLYVRNSGIGDLGSIAVQAYDDNATAPTFYYVWLIVEY